MRSALRWLHVKQASTQLSQRDSPPCLSITEGNQDILRGLVWCCCLEPDALTARTIGALGISAYRKVRFVGARAVRVGNACVFGLGVMGDADAVAQLAILKVKVKFGTAHAANQCILKYAPHRQVRLHARGDRPTAAAR